MDNYVSSGQTLTLTAPGGGVVSGGVYKINDLIVVAAADAAAAAEFEGQTVGVFTVAKTTGEAWTEGSKLYWNNSTSKFTTTSGGNTLAGVAAAAASSGAATGQVRLDGVAR